MAMAEYKIRIIANACITRYDREESVIETIIASYNLTAEDSEAVRAEITAKRPDIVEAA